MIILESVLNRLRGTGVIKHFATLDKVTQDALIAERQKAREFIRENS